MRQLLVIEPGVAKRYEKRSVSVIGDIGRLEVSLLVVRMKMESAS